MESIKSNPVTFWTDFLSGTGKDFTKEQLVQLSQIHQKNCFTIYNAWMTCGKKLMEVGRGGDIETLLKTSVDSSSELYKTYGDSMKEEMTALYQYWKNIVPAMTIPGATRA